MLANTATESIYSKKMNVVHSYEAYADELRTIENLLKMGWVRSGEVRLDARAKYLVAEIERLSKGHNKNKRRK